MLPGGSGIDALAGVTPTDAIIPDNRFDPGDYGAVAPATAWNTEQMAAGEADCRAAQAVGMDARNAMLGHYEAQGMPLGGHIGDGMTMPPSPLDPGVGSLGSGETSPWGTFYDPPRPGAPETSTAAGTNYQGNTGNEPH